jgi:tyrosinase
MKTKTRIKKTGKLKPSPTWYGDIQKLFTARDIACMQGQFGTVYNLGSYQFVAKHANQINQVVSSGYMPKGGPAWSKDKIDSFRAWIASDFPEGATERAARKVKALTTASKATRIRRDIRSLESEEIKKITAAFQGIMDLPARNPNSFFSLAALHWLPAPDFYCMHHSPGFLSWHRAYQIVFENALRSIPGCEDVTIPYWDITAEEPLPAWLFKKPFASYTYPQDVSDKYKKGSTTKRNSANAILKNLRGKPGVVGSDVFTDVANAMSQETWEEFNGFFADADYDTLIAGHDNGHNSIGATMQDQGVAAFDPIFWLFHNNWDRLFWEWQKQYNATTQAGMLSRISRDQASHDTFSKPIPAQLSPFTSMNYRLNAIGLLNLHDWDIDYAPPLTSAKPKAAAVGAMELHAAESFRMDTKMVHARVEGVNRLRIPGSFWLHLMKGKRVIGTRAFFQPSNVQECANCIENAIVHFDFILPAKIVASGTLSLWIEPVDKTLGKSIPLASLGNPTIEVRIPLKKAK